MYLKYMFMFQIHFCVKYFRQMTAWLLAMGSLCQRTPLRGIQLHLTAAK